MIPNDVHLHIGSLLFEGVDQIDLTGPFEVLSRIPNATYRIYGKTTAPVRDLKGLRLMPDAALADAPPLDVLHVPGGFGQEALMEDEEALAWIRQQAAGACSIFSVCTGALLCGAAGLLKGRRATTHSASFHCCRSLARSRSTSGWSSTALGSSPPALRLESTAPCASWPSCAARL
jgi:cyclohexyl-isocyanide hydratase